MLTIHDGVAVIALDNPPVNGQHHALCEHLLVQLEAALAEPSVGGIVLAGSDKACWTGGDSTEAGQSLHIHAPMLRRLQAAVETSDKPVVAALAGVTLGGSLELALACHGRVALESARVGLPSVALGLISGLGGTQRLPRLIGPDAALALILSGQPRSAKDLAASGLFDEVMVDGVVDAARRRALELAGAGAPLPQARHRQPDVAQVHAAVEAQRAKLHARQRLQPAYGAALDAVAACVLPFDQGMQRERELFLELVASRAARALHYQFSAEREATHLPAGLDAAPRPVGSVAVIGAGTMGSGIAIAALDAGLAVLLLEQDDAALARGRQRISDHYRDRVTSGKLRAVVAADNAARLQATTDWERLSAADLVIEAVFEDPAVKQQVFRQIDSHARPGAVLATNTSYLDIDLIATATARPQDVLGLHFFSPANVMKLLEVVRGANTARDVLATGMALGVMMNKSPVPCGNAFGFIGNRIYNAYRRQCEFMLEDGAWPEDVDNALTAMGFAMGPFAVADLSGLDIAWRMRKSQAAHREPRERYVAILDRLCEMGRLGRKTGAGYYNYADGKQAERTDTTVRDLIEQASIGRGVPRRLLPAEHIQRRALLAMVNEASLLLAEGVACRPTDVDVVMVQGYGFPRWEGGPVFWARQQDRTQLEADLQGLAKEAGYGFVVADLKHLFAD